MKKRYIHEGNGEVEPLPETPERHERLAGEAAGGHFTVRPLELPGWTLAHETSSKPVDAFPTVLTNTGNTAA